MDALDASADVNRLPSWRTWPPPRSIESSPALASLLLAASVAAQPADRIAALDAQLVRIFDTGTFAAPRFGPARWLAGRRLGLRDPRSRTRWRLGST
jgi:hypothetical protein